MDSDRLRQTYNRIAKDFYDEHSSDTWDDDYLKHLARALPQKARVLDLGCGGGNDSNKLADLDFDVTGIDISDEFIKIAKTYYPSLKFIQGDILRLPFKNDSFDGIFAKASLLHIAQKDMPNALKEAFRVLKSGGYIHIAIKGGEGEGEITESDYGYEYSRFFSYWKMEPFLEVLNGQGFKVVQHEMWKSSETSYTIWLKILAQKP